MGNSQSPFADGVIRYSETSSDGGLFYSALLADFSNPEDAVFVGHFTQARDFGSAPLEALLFNRTSQERDAPALYALDLVTGATTFRSRHDGNIFSGWIDATDEAIISDTNNDRFDDLVLFNRVADPVPFRSTNTGFVGMVSICDKLTQPDCEAGGSSTGAYRGFYRFFDWNFAKAGEQSVFPGYDDQNDHASFGLVINANHSESGRASRHAARGGD